jgi:hypothetical protein
MSDTNNYRLEPSVGEPREPTEATDDIDDSEVMSRVPLRRPVGVGIRELPVSTHRSLSDLREADIQTGTTRTDGSNFRVWNSLQGGLHDFEEIFRAGIVRHRLRPPGRRLAHGVSVIFRC